MSWEIHNEEQGRYLIARASGVMDADALRRFCAELIQTAQDQGETRVLIDHRGMIPNVSKGEIYQMPLMANELGARRNVRTALLIEPDHPHREDFEFYETVASNNGQILRLFTDMQQAETWLLRPALQPL
jgi:hypothetical protein